MHLSTLPAPDSSISPGVMPKKLRSERRRNVAESARVLVDSSVWIDFLRGVAPSATTVPALIKSHRVVICGQIKQEVLQGARDSQAFETLQAQMAMWEYE